MNTYPGKRALDVLAAGTARASERLDRLYLRRQSLLLDLKLIALSFAVNIAGKSDLIFEGQRCLA
jgi:hypothetical protein